MLETKTMQALQASKAKTDSLSGERRSMRGNCGEDEAQNIDGTCPRRTFSSLVGPSSIGKDREAMHGRLIDHWPARDCSSPE